MNSRKSLPLIVFILFAFPIFVSGQDIHGKIREMERSRFLRMEETFLSKTTKASASNFDVSYYQIRLDIDPQKEQISGDVTTKAFSMVPNLEEIELDFWENMAIDSVLSEDTHLFYTRVGNRLIINLVETVEIGEIFTATVYYRGHPVNKGGFHPFTFEYHQGEPIISTLSEPFGSPTWWPCKDDPNDKADSVDIIITVPSPLVVASNGILANTTDHGDGTRTFFWKERYPISTYLVSLAISNYETYSDWYYYRSDGASGEIDSMEVQFYVYPEDLRNAKRDFSVTVPMIEYYSSVFGEYPFIKEKYGMAEFPWWGAMEHQTCTSYGSVLIDGSHRYDWIIAHELAHQWFGDLITMKRWSHIWLNEGFATYAEALWEEQRRGKKSYLDYMKRRDSDGWYPTSVFVYDSTSIKSLFDRTVYDKGAWVLHMLRHVIGDSTFFLILKQYGVDFAFGNATTEDFRFLCESYYGHDLEWFFNQWVYGRFRPIYRYSWNHSIEGDHHVITLKLSQAQTNTGLFKMPLDVTLTTATGDTTFVVWDSLKFQTFEFVLDEDVFNIEIDPEGWMLKTVDYRVDIVEESFSPKNFSLSPNYPNPFNATTLIRYELPYQGVVLLDIYDISGRKVRRLINRSEAIGHYLVRWNGRDEQGKFVSSGIYLFSLSVEVNGDVLFHKIRKMILVR